MIQFEVTKKLVFTLHDEEYLPHSGAIHLLNALMWEVSPGKYRMMTIDSLVYDSDGNQVDFPDLVAEDWKALEEKGCIVLISGNWSLGDT